MVTRKILGIGVCLTLSGCLTPAQVTSVETKISSYEVAVRNAYSTFETYAASPLGSLASVIPAVDRAVKLGKSGCDTEEAIASLVLSPTSFAWVNTLTTTIKSKGTIIPPAPIEVVK